ncbi:putative methyltransferase PMT26 [Hordeum vulgare]|nr:putative methyltransferase PMT26 [Hordeum vulgare]
MPGPPPRPRSDAACPPPPTMTHAMGIKNIITTRLDAKPPMKHGSSVPTPPRPAAQRSAAVPPSALGTEAMADGSSSSSWGPSPAAVTALVALLGLGVATYIIGPPLYWHVAEALSRSPGACPSSPKRWYSNVPHTKLVQYKGKQNWVNVSRQHLVFPGGGTQIKHGALHYIDFIQEAKKEMAWGKRTRVVLDVGCGVASFGGYLFERDALAMSFAPKDEHEVQDCHVGLGLIANDDLGSS